MNIIHSKFRSCLFLFFLLGVITCLGSCATEYQPSYLTVADVAAKSGLPFDGTWTTQQKAVYRFDRGRVSAVSVRGIKPGGINGKNIKRISPGRYALEWLTWNKTKRVSSYGPAHLKMVTLSKMKITIAPNQETGIVKELNYILNKQHINNLFAYLQEWEQQADINDNIDKVLKAYRSFLYGHPKSPYHQQAKARIAELSWEKVRKADTIYDYRRYLRANPKSPYKNEAKERIAELEWEKIQKADTITAYRRYLRSHRKSPYKRQAEERIVALEWEKVQNANSITVYETFIKAYPKSAFTSEAKLKIVSLNYQKVKEIDTIKAYQEFMYKFPNSKYRPLIKLRLNELIRIKDEEKRKQAERNRQEWETTKKINTAEAYRQFFSKNPNSMYKDSPDGLAKLFKKCKSGKCSDYLYSLWDQAQWEKARIADQRKVYRKYLLLFPNGKHVPQANRAIDNLDWQPCLDNQSQEDCENYLSLQKKGKYRSKAKEILINLEFAAVKELNTIEGYQKFLKKHYNHQAAKTGLRQLRYTKAVETGKFEDWIDFYDKSKVSSYARKKWEKSDRSTYEKMMANAKTEIEQLLFNDVTSKPSLKSAKEYLKRFPEGIHKQQVKILAEPLFFKEAHDVNTVVAYNKYLKIYPTGFSSEKIQELMEKVLWSETEKKNNYKSYQYYSKKYPKGPHVKQANEKLLWMKANPAKPAIDHPNEIIGTGSRPKFSWVTKFTEESGRVGYYVSGSGWVIDSKGNKWGPNGHKGSRGTVKVKAGGKGQDSHWVRGSTFCGGRLEYTWIGEDENGHKIRFVETIFLKCKK
jgi:outer membrane protein assembly factor BamD (BamD/ComL family)